jgi:hypothetical protein
MRRRGERSAKPTVRNTHLGSAARLDAFPKWRAEGGVREKRGRKMRSKRRGEARAHEGENWKKKTADSESFEPLMYMTFRLVY